MKEAILGNVEPELERKNNIRMIQKSIMSMFLFAFLSAVSITCFADYAETIEEAFKDGKIKGTIGTYFEYTDKDAPDKNYGWGTGYISLKYETLEWNRIKSGIGFFAHGQLYNESDYNSDSFNADIEKEYTLPEFYLNLGFMEESSIRMGRWNHKKITHIDDAQSEGFYVQIKEIPDVEVVVGLMTRFAEIDYDDGEDFGRTGDSQDLDSEGSFGSGSERYLLFLETKVKALDMLELNPYIMYQDGYAGVYGLDTDLKYCSEYNEITYGGRIDFYHVAADISGSKDSDNFAVSPYIEKGPFTVSVGFAQFDDDNGDAMNKPSWHRDYLVAELDQDKPYGSADCEVYFGKVKYSMDKFWTHFALGDYNYNMTSSKGDSSLELEWQVGYKFTKNLDINFRFFDVAYDNVDDKDYQKVEGRVRFKF